MRGLAATLALLLAVPLCAEEPPTWRAVDATIGQIADVAGFEQLARDFPDSTSVRLRLVKAQLEAGEGEGALISLRWLARAGHVFGDRAKQQIPNLIGSAYAGEARAILAGIALMIGNSDVFDTVPAEGGLVESVSILADGAGAAAISVSGRTLFVFDLARASDRPPAWEEIRVLRANALAGIVKDPGRRTLWVASSNIAGSPQDAELFEGLIGLEGGFDKFRHIPAPAGVTVADLAAGPDGTVYASDPKGGEVYRARPGAAALEVLVEPGTFRSPQGLAVSAEGARLYVSDYRYGLAVVELASGAVTRLASDVPAALDGVDGLWLHKGELIAIQNGTSPMRISAFTLSEDGTRITAHRVLEQAHPEWTEPLGGSIANDALYYVATGQWDRYDKGVLREGMAAIPTVIRRLPIRP